MLYPYAYRYKLGDFVVLFHPINMATLYVKKELLNNEKKLYDVIKKSPHAEEWLVPDDFSYDEYIEKIIKKNDTQAIDIKTLKMFTTTKCNLDCAYCLIEKNLENRDVDHHNLGLEDGINVLSSFSKLAMQQRTSKKTIMLYGGEPLINKDNLFRFIEYIRENERKGLFNGEVEIVLESNETLVTESVAQFLKKHGVFVIVSIDGTPRVHNRYRKKKDKSNSYEEARKGFEILISEGCTAVVSSVFTDEYAHNVEECIEHMTEEIKPKSIGLNLFHVLENQRIENDNTEQYYERYIQSFELARQKGLYIEHIMRRIRPLVTRKVRIKDCGACGNRIVSDVDGNIGICEGMVGNAEYFFKRNNFNEVKDDPVFLAWSKRTPLTIDYCRKCPAIGICGAGCVNNALLQNGDIYSPDNYICGSSKAFVDWALKMWFVENNIAEKMESGFHFLSYEERQSLRGTLGEEFDIPLQTMSKQYESEGEV